MKPLEFVEKMREELISEAPDEHFLYMASVSLTQTFFNNSEVAMKAASTCLERVEPKTEVARGFVLAMKPVVKMFHNRILRNRLIKEYEEATRMVKF